MMDSFEKITPDLTKGKLLSDIGGTARVYDGIFQGTPVVIKEARNLSVAPIIQSEHDFLLTTPGAIEHQLSNYGIPTDWTVRTRFVKVIPDAVTKAMYDKGVTVLEKIDGRALVNSDESINLGVPLKFHFGSIMGWIDMLRNLRKRDITMDSNIDSDLLLSPDLKTKTIHAVRIDCSPSPGGAEGLSILQLPNSQNWMRINRNSQRLTQEQVAVDQVISILNRLYPKGRQYSSFLGASIPALRGRFQEGDVHDSETLFNTLKSGLQRADWEDDFVKSGDNIRVTKSPP